MSSHSHPPRHDVLCIGNAIVDTLAQVPAQLITTLNAEAGTMKLVDGPAMQELLSKVTVEAECSGGSVANSAVVAARLGAKAAFIGKVARDEGGHVFTHDLKAQHVDFVGRAARHDHGEGTGRCMVMVTPDGQRTMFTYLGISVRFDENDIPPETVADSGIVYLEGYLFDDPQAQKAFHRAAELAHEHGRQVALTLSDSFCIERHRKAFQDFIRTGVDVLFANDDEIKALYQVADLDDALARLAKDVAIGAVTRGQQGAVVVEGSQRFDVPTTPVKAVDTTGAGDAFAGGFLAAFVQGKALEACADLGNRAAGCIITHMGARPGADFIKA
ncbi:adenosine kinase [Formicincola oecophyllae]|uniref:Adenosine kinase n=1 Tax=Formicincola oecophyllae TaxID=2558361 RepID=A0A4Y6UB60_9PROT|nr:adenosine kinase [Formicincola oecophyllae]QDH13697.1 adenosine kinase [Formicincola oecophyllae]